MLDAGQNIITRHLPKTGQIVQYRAGDDGHYEAGWWKGRLNSNNRTRWIQKTISGDDVVLDRATGLMWAADGNALGCAFGSTQNWNNAIDCANTLTFAGFGPPEWRVPNINELLSILYYATNAPTIEQPPFSNTKSGGYWSSTTYHIDTTKALVVFFNTGHSFTYLKTLTTPYLRCVRKGL